MGYGTPTYHELNKFSIEFSNYDKDNKTFVYKQNHEGKDFEKKGNILDHFFKEPVKLTKGVKYTIIETSAKDNGNSYHIKSNSQSNTEFDFSDNYTLQSYPPMEQLLEVVNSVIFYSSVQTINLIVKGYLIIKQILT